MDAALVLLRSHCVRRIVERRARWEEVTRRERRALRRDLGVSREVVQQRDDPAAVLLDFREGVRLAALVERRERLPQADVEVGRREVPRAHGLVLRELRDELVELHAPRASAAAGAEHRVERRRIAGVLDHDAADIDAAGIAAARCIRSGRR